MRSTDSIMSRFCSRLMTSEQSSIDTLSYTLDDMEYYVESNPEREDIKACIADIKSKIKADASKHWAILNEWMEHFDGITQGDLEEEKDSEKTDEDSKATE